MPSIYYYPYLFVVSFLASYIRISLGFFRKNFPYLKVFHGKNNFRKTAQKIPFRTLEGQKPGGRLRHRWEDNIKTVLE